MKLFGNKKNNEIIKTEESIQIPANHISKKKKNTYIIQFSSFYDAGLFSMCKQTPLGITTINGQPAQSNDGWIKCTEFPNPCASEMATHQHLLCEALGSKLSTTIIEYLDKSTGTPVLQLYPNGVHIFDGYEDNYMSALNHASRRDFAKQYNLRKKMLDRYYNIQKQKNF